METVAFFKFKIAPDRQEEIVENGKKQPDGFRLGNGPTEDGTAVLAAMVPSGQGDGEEDGDGE